MDAGTTDTVAVVLGRGANAHDTARLLSSHSIRTFLLSPVPLKDGKHTGAEFLRCPDPSDVDALSTFLNERVAPDRQVVLLAATDAFATFLAYSRDLLDTRFSFLHPAPALTKALDNKFLFYRLCQEHNIPCPLSFAVQNERDYALVRKSVRFPCVVKPPYSGDWSEDIGYKVQVVFSQQELDTLVETVLSHDRALSIQDMIPGTTESIFFVGGLYDERSEPVKLYVGQKLLQHPLDVGSTCYARLRWNPEVVNLANAFAKRTGYSGLVDIEFKYDRRDGLYKIIEVNPRNGLWHKISSDGRWDISTFYYLWLCGVSDRAITYQAHTDGRTWTYPHRHLCSRIEETGLWRGSLTWLREMPGASVRCAHNGWDLYRYYRGSRIVLGHLRTLGIRVCFRGRNGEMRPRGCQSALEKDKASWDQGVSSEDIPR